MAVPTTPNFDQGAAKAAVDQQKAAMLAALAQGGTAMAQQTAMTQQQMAASSQQAAQMAAARSVSPAQAAQAAGGAGDQGAYYAQLAATQGGAGATAMNTISQVNSNYMDQVGAAVPLVHAQAGREIASMQHAAGEASADRALRQQIARLQLQETQARISAADRSASGANRTPEDIEHDRLVNARLTQELNGTGPKSPAEQLAALKLAEAQQGVDLRSYQDDLLKREGANAANAARLALAGSENQAEALASLDAVYARGSAKTPNNKDLDRKYMEGLIARLYARPAAPTYSAPVGGLNRPGA